MNIYEHLTQRKKSVTSPEAALTRTEHAQSACSIAMVSDRPIDDESNRCASSRPCGMHSNMLCRQANTSNPHFNESIKHPHPFVRIFF